jgi:hypothetical protein
MPGKVFYTARQLEYLPGLFALQGNRDANREQYISFLAKYEIFQAFDMSELEKHMQQYAEETKHKYGHTGAYSESQKKTAAYSKENWASIQARDNEIYHNIADLMEQGPADPQVLKVIARGGSTLPTATITVPRRSSGGSATCMSRTNVLPPALTRQSRDCPGS